MTTQPPRIAVIYYSATGHTHDLARAVADGASAAGAAVRAPGYTDPAISAAGGNPYGTSATVERDAALPAAVLAAARHQGRRLAAFAALLASRRAFARVA